MLRELQPTQCRQFLGEYEDSVYTVIQISFHAPLLYVVVMTDAYESYEVSSPLSKGEIQDKYQIQL